jgi:hypothetical protein
LFQIFDEFFDYSGGSPVSILQAKPAIPMTMSPVKHTFLVSMTPLKHALQESVTMARSSLTGQNKKKW